jgi:hypothetical protein
MPPLAGLDKLSLWISQDSSDRHYLFVDLKSMTPIIRLDFEGGLSFLQHEKRNRWEWVIPGILEGNSRILELDPFAFILQDDPYLGPRNLLLQKHLIHPSDMLMQFPHLIDSSGEVLEFVRKWDSEIDELSDWVLKNKPHLHISKNQFLPGIRNFNQFIIVENASGKREALIPIKTKNQIDSKEVAKTSCISVNIKQGELVSQDPKTNIYLAYLCLIHATTSEDYQRAMKFLQASSRFESYTDEELRLLGWIFHSPRMTQDHTGPSDAIRLFAAWLVQDNFKRNPQEITPIESIKEFKKKKISALSPPDVWNLFWKENLEKENLEKQISKLTVHYFERQHHLPQGMRLQEILSDQELKEWDLKLHQRTGSLKAPVTLQEASCTKYPNFQSPLGFFKDRIFFITNGCSFHRS